MLALGLILIVVAGVLLIGAVAGGANDEARLVVGSLDITVSTMWVFLAGAATLLALAVGLSLVRSGARRAARRRRDARELQRLSERLEEHEARERGEPEGQPQPVAPTSSDDHPRDGAGPEPSEQPRPRQKSQDDTTELQ